MTSGVLTPEGDLGPPPGPVARVWRARVRSVLCGPIEAPTWRAVGYLIVGIPLAAVGFGVDVASMFFGVLLALTFLGFPIIALGGLFAVRLGIVQRRLAASMLGEEVPAARGRVALPGFFGWLQSRLTDPRDWRARLFQLIHFPLTAAGTYLIVILYIEGLIGTLYPILWQLSGQAPRYQGNGLLSVGFGFDSGRPPGTTEVPHRFTLHVGAAVLDTWPRALAVCATGIVVLLAVPWLARGLARLDVTLMRALLGPSVRSRQIERLEAARGVVAEDAAATLRRIERDLHDGTQAQLLALAMNLGELKERLEAGEGAPGDARFVELVTASHDRAKEALAELRGIAGGLTVPLMPLVGGHWRPALALWTVPAVAACLLWLPQFFRAPGRGAPPPGAGGVPAASGQPSFRAILTDPVAIAVTAFMGVQSTGYYVTLTWLPTLLQDHGMDPHSAGWMLSYSAFPGIAAALVSPALARRIRPTWVPIVVSVLCYGAAYAGLATDPVHAAYLWMTLLGLGQGASISLSLSYIAWRSPDARHTAQVSTMAQGFGYLLASTGPIAIGAIHSASGSWTVPIAVLAALLVPQLIAGVLASRERLVLASRDDRVARWKSARAAMMAYEVTLDPWDDERDWFTPGDGSPPPQDPEDGPPSVEGEPEAG